MCERAFKQSGNGIADDVIIGQNAVFRVHRDGRPGAVGYRGLSSAGRRPGVRVTSRLGRRSRRPRRLRPVRSTPAGRRASDVRRGENRCCRRRGHGRGHSGNGQGQAVVQAPQAETADRAAGQGGPGRRVQARGRCQAGSQSGRRGRQGGRRRLGRPESLVESGQSHGEGGHRAGHQSGAAQLLVPRKHAPRPDDSLRT